MYVELFLLDNMLMDALILRAAAALLRKRISCKRLVAASACGALYALAAFYAPAFGSLPMKLLSGALMSLALPFRDLRDFLRGALCVLLSSLVIGGFAVVLAIACGGGAKGGVILASFPLRLALIAACAAAFLPNVIRRMQAGSARDASIVTLNVRFGESTASLRALVDTGSSLCEPLTGLPVAVAFAPELLLGADIPVPCALVSGEAVLFAKKPDSAILAEESTAELPLLIAAAPKPFRGFDAIIPAFALQNIKKEVLDT